jgi:hypothetical protein
MGAWSHNSFDNDDALDWVARLEGSDDTSAIVDALNGVTDDAQPYIEAPQCSAAIAAAEVVAAMNGKGAGSLPPEVTQWLVGNPTADASLIAKARLAVDAVLTDSELKELWEENEEDYPKWTALLDDLKRRLS